MSEAIITGIVAIIVCVINNWALMAKQRAQTEKTVALIEYKNAFEFHRWNRVGRIDRSGCRLVGFAGEHSHRQSRY